MTWRCYSKPCLQQLLETGDQSRTIELGDHCQETSKQLHILFYSWVHVYNIIQYVRVLMCMRTTSMYWICQAFMKFHSFPPAELPTSWLKGTWRWTGLCNFHDGTMDLVNLYTYDLWLIVNDYEWLWFRFLAKNVRVSQTRDCAEKHLIKHWVWGRVPIFDPPPTSLSKSLTLQLRVLYPTVEML